MSRFVVPFRLVSALALFLACLAVPAHADDHDSAGHGEHAHAHAFTAGAIKIVHPWSRASDADHAFVFLEIENSGAADRLLAASSGIAKSITIVGMTLGPDGVLTDVEIGPLDIPAGRDFKLDPAGAALRLDGISQPLAEGDELDLTLTFETAGTLEIEAEVEASDAREHSHAGHSH